ncbi:hypothetical protein IFM89_031113 [Coptis chinensis]|uniref:CCHC-type domain-containing protein n=1 Tax=Coptis chinensis TaxID=261450 RepID=A0A835INN6_9MAGN|nr:hypothetical protein IFM89_031113 [Coptis chinensis]
MGGRTNRGRGIGQCGGYERKTPPEGYVCHRCNTSGHFIQHCPTNGDPNYDRRVVKKPTGILKSMLIETTMARDALGGVVSPSLSFAPKGGGMPPSLKKDTPKMKQANLKFHSLERGGIGTKADMSEVTFKLMPKKEPMLRGNALHDEEEVQQKMPTGEVVKEKKKKTNPLSVNAAELHWRASQDCATGYYMMPPAHSPYDPYWGGMQIGMDGYMAPYAIAMPYTQNPFGGLSFPMPAIPPQRNPPRNVGFKRKRC